jgi:hypothetical protein
MIIQAVNCHLAAAGGGGGGTDPNFSSVVLRMGFEGTNGSTTFVDESAAAHTMTANGGAQISTAQQKFGAASMLNSANTDFVTSADNADWEFGSGDFTIEFFVRHSTTVTASGYADHYTASGNRAWTFYRSSNQMWFQCWVAGSSKTLTSTTVAATAGTWYHYCAERSGTTLRMYRDGVMVASLTGVSGAVDNPTSALNIGRANNSSSFNLIGNLDEFRITKGVARYASDSGFTVPTAAFPRS